MSRNRRFTTGPVVISLKDHHTETIALNPVPGCPAAEVPISMLIKNLFTYWTGQAISPGSVLKRKYDAYKSLLEQDKRAHDLMAELEELYHDQVRVDFSVIEKKYAALSECVGRIVSDLNRMHPSRYLELNDFFQKIDAYARHLLAQPKPAADAPFCLQLADAADTERLNVGGKASSLAHLGRHFNLPVPSGFVITTAAFYHFIRHNRLKPFIDNSLASIDINDPGALDLLSQKLQLLILAAEVPPPVAAEVAAMVALVFGAEADSPPVAVRSSAVGEDGEASFAGQYKTLLNVDKAGILEAYKEVVASKYSPEALVYRINYGFTDMETPMAVLVVEMIDALASGVVYTEALNDPTPGMLEVHSVFGLGELLVQGDVGADLFKVKKGRPPAITEKRSAAQQHRMVSDRSGRTRIEALAGDRGAQYSIDEASVLTLAEWGMRLEHHANGPRDIEWCLDRAGQLRLLQSRPLITGQVHTLSPECRIDAIDNRILLSGGQRAASGVGSGPVFLATAESALSQLPEHAVLVTRSATAHYVRAMEKVSAVIAETGSTAGHFASVAREFGIPTIVNAEGATRKLVDGMIVTVFADQGVVFEGSVEPLLANPCLRKRPIADSPLTRKLTSVMGFVSPLTLLDPGDPGFTPGGCRSLHDIIRFAHEAGTREMFVIGDRAFGKGRGAKKLVSTIPLLLYLMDVGGAFSNDTAQTKTVRLEEIRCAPFLSVWKGLTHPGVQWSEFTHFNWAEYDKIVMSGGIISAESAQLASYAVLSSTYLNLNLKFGYHFVILDTFCGDNPAENHILFRFDGGGGDDHGRSLRAAFLYEVLGRLEFDVSRKSDLVDARLYGSSGSVISEKLDLLGRLLGATRLMDMYLSEAHQVAPFVEAFLKGKYHFSSVEMEG
jgi:pyruvate,water dikinase